MAAPAWSQDRIALVIGNSSYEHVPSLDTAARDAELVAAQLGQIGFDVTLEIDLGFEGLLAALNAFEDRAIQAEIALIYYSGLGFEIDRHSYLVPVTARPPTGFDREIEAVALDRLLLATEGADRLRVVVVDACREPLAVAVPSTPPSRPADRSFVPIAQGLATLVAHSTAHGSCPVEAAYARALSDALAEPGLEIGAMFRIIRDDVLEATGLLQEPYFSASLPAEQIVLNGTAAPAGTGPAAPGLPDRDRYELSFWSAIAESTDPRDFEDFLARFPGSTFTGLAERRLAALSIPLPAEPEPLLDPPDAVDLAPISVTRDVVRGVQVQLNALGHNTGLPDGVIGPRTRQGIEAFQSATGFEATGQIDAALVARLNRTLSVDRAVLQETVLGPLRSAILAADGIGGLYCLEASDGTIADGLEGRPMTCQLVLSRGGRLELRSYYDHVRLDPEGPITVVFSRLFATDGDGYSSVSGTPFSITQEALVMGDSVFLRAQ
ncbi:MAG: caspase family protein [Pseudomonadota bacterium]